MPLLDWVHGVRRKGHVGESLKSTPLGRTNLCTHSVEEGFLPHGTLQARDCRFVVLRSPEKRGGL